MDTENTPSPDNTPAPEAPDTSAEAPVDAPAPVEGEQPPAETPDESTPVDDPESGSNDDAPEQDSVTELSEELYFNGEQVKVEVPDDIKASLDDAGVDVNKAINELYSKDGDFTLSEETRKPLDDKYGKGIVDTYLNALKTQNESVLKNLADDKASAEEADRQAVEWSNELVGGEENWSALEDWAAENLEDGQIESFNKAMESGDPWIQELAINKLAGQMQEAEGDTSVSLISGDAGSGSDNSPMSAQDYIAAMTAPSFTELRGDDRAAAQAKLDARRRAGMKRGM